MTRFRLPHSRRPVVLSALLLAGCAAGPVDVQTAAAVPLRLERRDALRLAESLLGAYAGGGAVASGLVSGAGDALTIHPQTLAPAVRAALRDADGDGAVGWDELSAFVAATYAAGHRLPATLAGLDRPAAPGDTAWVSVDVEGSVMTHARRRVSVRASALRAAMTSFAAGDSLRYPVGTVIVGEHLDGQRVAETTVKRRRADGFWDFAVYDAAGRLATATATAPRPLRAPTQCTGCHLGRRLFEPERAFPATPADGPDGPRRYAVPDAWRSRPAAALFAEHARRDDGVLGVYATLYAGRLAAARTAGEATAADLALLTRLGL